MKGAAPARLSFRHQLQIGGGCPSTCTSYQLAIDSGSPTNPSGLKLCKNDMQNSRKCYCYNYNFTVKFTIQSTSQDQPDEETHEMRSGTVLGMMHSCPQDGSPPSTSMCKPEFLSGFHSAGVTDGTLTVPLRSREGWEVRLTSGLQALTP